VVLAGGQRQHVLAVAHDDEAGLLALRNSSITTRAPPSLWLTPSVLSTSMKSIASCASASVIATTTPLPAARPSALMTMGAPMRST
jgi:hypothetical protein